ncbi:hypothetical protein GCM10027290_44440 [Micromonospora sonneratiae]
MVQYLRAANVKDGVLDLSDMKSMNFTPGEQRIFALHPGDVLVTEGSGSLSSVGASAVWQGEIKGPICFQNTLLRLRPRSYVMDGRFLGWWAQSAFGSGVFASLAGGANIYHLSAERVRALRIKVPPPDEQRRIADFLDVETARIDYLVGARIRQRAMLDERWYAGVSETLIPGSTQAARGAGPWPWLPPMQKERPLVRLGYVCRLQGGITVDGNREVDRDAVTRPYLRVANVQSSHIDLTSVTEVTVPRTMAERSTLRPGDVLMTEGGDIDKLGRGTVWDGQLEGCLHQNHVFALRPEPDRLDAHYLALMTQTLHGRAYFESTGSRTTNLASTSSSKIMSFPIPLPPVTLQRELVCDLMRRQEVLNRTKKELDRQLALLTERRQTLITAAVTGQVDIPTTGGQDFSTVNA